MDPITHGITGALLAKAFFASPLARVFRRGGSPEGPAPEQAGYRGSQGRDAQGKPGPGIVWVGVLAAMFPDVDIFLDPFIPSRMATLELHRWITHSFICLPLFTAAMAWLTWWWLRWRAGRGPKPAEENKERADVAAKVTAHNASGAKRPKTRHGFAYARLAALWAVGLASHIFLDLVTSWGTMIWSPLSNHRAAWDLVFILDFTLTGILLLPQVLAWVYASRQHAPRRAILAWVLFTACAVLLRVLTAAVGLPFETWAIPVVSVALAAPLFLPRTRGWGFRVQRASWCRVGAILALVYVMLCAVGHAMAFQRVVQFAVARGLVVENIGALPMPPSLLRWMGLVRTPEGVHQAVFNVLDSAPPEFQLIADSPANRYVEQARRLPDVQTYLWFARFPVVRYSSQPPYHVVESLDLRFFPRGASRPAPFQYRVVFDAHGRVVEQGWVD